MEKTRKERYREYLQSPDWRAKRAKKRSRRDRCAICGDTRNLDVHHLNYRQRWTDVTMADLRVFCRRCHDLTHQLIEAGVIVYKNGSDNHRFTVTKNALLRVLGPKDMHWPRGHGHGPGPTSRGGHTRAQLAAWGVPWPPPKGWKKRLMDELSNIEATRRRARTT